MRSLRAWFFRLGGLSDRQRRERELAEELESHLALHIEDNLRAGMTPVEARRQALIKLGGIEQTKEMYRDRRGIPLLEGVIQDVRYGLRMLRKSPGFTAIAVLTLALGIGGTTAIFSVVECAVLDPFPYADSHRLVGLVSYDSRDGSDEAFGELWTGVTAPEFLAYQEQNHVFDSVFGAAWDGEILTGSGPAKVYEARPVTGNFFSVLGVPPLIGRLLTPQDFKPGAPPVAVLGYKAWQRDFGGDPGILGRTLVLNRRPTTVVGVMPSRFTLQAGEVYLPATLSKTPTPGGGQFFSVFAHLKPGVTVEQANAEIVVLAKRLAAAYHNPPDLPDRSYAVVPFSHGAIGAVRKTWYALLGAVGLLLLIACVNVANLLLARATAREKEIAVRAALGAGRRRLVRQFLVESLLLATSGAVLGCLLAWDLLGALIAIIPSTYVPGEAAIRINTPVLGFAVSSALLCTLLFGLAPAIHATNVDVQEPLKVSGRGVSDSSGRSRLRNLLVVGEVALSLVLLTGAGLLIRSFFQILHANLGYNPDHLLQFWTYLPEGEHWTPDQIGKYQVKLLRRVRAVPGVVSAALESPPLIFSFGPTRIEIAGKPGAENWSARLHGVSDRLFETAGIPLLRGRGLSEQEWGQRRKVALINRTFARKYFSGENPLGRQIKVPERATGPDPIPDPWFEVIGVVGDIRDNGPDNPPEPSIYVPYWRWQAVSILVRAVGDPAALTSSLQGEAAMVDKDLPLENDPMRDQLSKFYYVEPRFVVSMLAALAALGLVLVSVGVYGVLSYSVAQRTQEIGIRMALGAEAGDVRRMVMISTLRWLAVGIGFGVPMSIALAKMLQNRIWGIKAADPWTLATVSFLLTAVGLAACYFPARRATRVDPTVALRFE